VQSFSAVANQFLTSISTAGVLASAQPAFSNLSGSVAASQLPALTGDVTTTAGTVATTIAANAVTNAKSAQMAAATLKGNPTASTANASDFTIQGLTARGAPDATNDKILIFDNAAGTLKYVTPALVAAAGAAGVSSFNSLTGAVTSNVVLQVFTASGTYTPTSGMAHAIITCVGGGGGGGGAASTAGSNHTGGGGGAGGVSIKRVIASDIGASKAVTIGAAGSGTTTNGGAGGDTSLGVLCIGKGASGGTGGLNAISFGSPGLGGVSGTGDASFPGMPGGAGGIGSTTIYIPSGMGGSSAYGAGGGAVVTGANANGNGATGYGCGGSGALSYNTTTAATGGNGSAGLVMILEFINL
jgi:hypothetical protein